MRWLGSAAGVLNPLRPFLCRESAGSRSVLGVNEEVRNAWTLLRQGQVEQADFVCRRILRGNPLVIEAVYVSGLISLLTSRNSEAMAYFRRALALGAESPELLANLGIAETRCGELGSAIDRFQCALRRRPTDAAAENGLGNALVAAGRTEEGIESYQRALRLRPDFLEALVNLGIALRNSGRSKDALEYFEHALRLKPNDAAIHYDMGNSLQDLGRSLESIESLQRALALRADYADAACNLGTVYYGLGRSAEAIECFKRVLRIRPSYAEAELSMALVYLRGGDFKHGWKHYEARLNATAATGRIESPPLMDRWNGNFQIDCSLVLVAEQGFGDAIQFIRYAQLLNAQGIRPVLQCHARLVKLLASSGWFHSVVPHGHDYSGGAYVWCALMSLPRRFGTDLQSIPAPAPYLTVEPWRREHWAAKLRAEPGILNVGIAWQGNPNSPGERRGQRSFSLQHLQALARMPGIRLICLQKGAGIEQIGQVDFRDCITQFGDELDSGADAFLDTAALLDSLDLVITPDSALAHLAGALGRPVWVALMYAADWRWFEERIDTPWYPTMRLFRQGAGGDWSQVFEDIRQVLERRVARQSLRQEAG